MKFDVDDQNRCRLVCVKFHLNRCRFAVAVAKYLGAHFFGTQCIYLFIYNENRTKYTRTIRHFKMIQDVNSAFSPDQRFSSIHDTLFGFYGIK